jgi:predicted O-methyltransferase YrrM
VESGGFQRAMDKPLGDELIDATTNFAGWMKRKRPWTNRESIEWLRNVKSSLRRLAAGETLDWGPEATSENFHAVARLACIRLCELYGAALSEENREEFVSFIDSIRPYIARGPYQFSFDGFSARVESWKSNLNEFVGIDNLRFLEVGSLEGYSACWLLENILTGKNCQLTCIDAFLNNTETRFDMNISRAPSTTRVLKLRGFSRDTLPALAADAYDFTYIDGSHHQVSVLEDEIFSWRLLRRGGIMIMDDYTLSKNPLHAVLADESQRPDKAIDAFLSIYAGRYELMRCDDQVAVRKL